MANIIKINLSEREDYKNIYNEDILSYILSDYILEETKGISLKNNIKFLVSSNFIMDDKEKENLVFMIRNNFGAEISEIINLSKKQLLANLFIFILGIFLLFIYSLLNFNFISEFILILSWIFLGEAICNLLYKFVENRYKIKKYKQIVDAKVEFK